MMGVALLILAAGSLWQLHSALLDSKETQVRIVVQAVMSIINRHYEAARAGEISEAEAKRQALLELGRFRYDNGNYVWVTDDQPVVLLHPIRKDLEGRDVSGFRDAKGKFVFVEFARAAKAGGGYVYYTWPRPQTTIDEPKISYVASFAPWQWVVGTGLYVGDVDDAFLSRAWNFSIFLSLVLAGALTLSLRIARTITKPLESITDLTVRLNNGETDFHVPHTESVDEIGELARALEVFKEHTRTIAHLRRMREEEQQQAAEELRASEERVRLLLECTGDGIYAVDTEGRFTIVNPAAARALGFESPEQVLGRNAHSLSHHHFEDGRAYPMADCPIYACALSGRSAHVVGELFFRNDGSSFPVDYRVHPLQRDGKIIGAVVSFTDITERHLAEEEMKVATAVFETTTEGIMVTDADTRIKTVNPAFERITGYRCDEVVGKTPRILASGRHDSAFYAAMWADLLGQGNWQGEIWDKRKNGEIYAEWLTITALKGRNGERVGFVAIFSDITSRAHAAERTRQEANFDSLTELPNRRFFEREFECRLAIARAESSRLGVFFVDLDRFKPVNDYLGHSIGDSLLVEVASRLKSCVRNSDLIARLGGDEFIIVVAGLVAPNDASMLAAKIVDAVAKPYLIKGQEIKIGASVGVALYPNHGEDARTLLQKADTAMYRAKEAGRSGFCMAE
jgi:diguanylate cyclase (GGDEF)-like protein/PAS domain S-box-containing protein